MAAIPAVLRACMLTNFGPSKRFGRELRELIETNKIVRHRRVSK